MSSKRESKEAGRGIVQTGLDFAIGGTAMAIDKASELVHDARERVEDAADNAKQKVEEARDRVEKDVGRAREAAEDTVEKAADKADELADKAEKQLTGKDTRRYEERTVDELRELAAEREIDGRSRMNKDDLISELRS